jgi:hypothetical protein
MIVPHEPNVFTPYSFTQAVSRSEITLDRKVPHIICGIYRDRRGRKFGETYYDRLEDEATQTLLTIRLAKRLKVKLVDGHSCQVEGVITHNLTDNDGQLGIHLIFQVHRARRLWDEPPLDERERKSMYDEVLGLRIDKPRTNIDQIIGSAFTRKGLAGKPRIALIIPDSGVTRNDILKPLGWNSDDRYEISPHPVSMSSKEAVIAKLQELDRSQEYDLIALARGGGAGLRLFNDHGIARALVAMQTPVVTALGHEDDKPFAEAVADRTFPTPTAFGNYLQQMKSSAKREQLWQHKEKGEYEQKLRELGRQREAERTKLLGAITNLTHTVNELRAELKDETQATQGMVHRTQGKLLFRIAGILIVGVVVGAAGMLVALRYTSLVTLTRPEPTLNKETQPSGSNQALPAPAPAYNQSPTNRPPQRDRQHRR